MVHVVCSVVLVRHAAMERAFPTSVPMLHTVVYVAMHVAPMKTAVEDHVQTVKTIPTIAVHVEMPVARTKCVVQVNASKQRTQNDAKFE